MDTKSLEKWTFAPVTLGNDSVGETLFMSFDRENELTDTNLAFIKGLFTYPGDRKTMVKVMRMSLSALSRTSALYLIVSRRRARQFLP
jgi:hypothetical protein